MRFFYSFFIALMLVSCSGRLRVPKNQEGKSMDFLAMNEIMKKSKSQISKPKHLIVAFQYTHTAAWSITLYRFIAIVLDTETNRRLYLVNDDDNQFKTYLTDKTSRFEKMDLILKYFVDGKLNDLLRSQEHFKDGGDNATIFDINFAASTTREYDFDQLSFDENGNLTTFKKLNELKSKARHQ